MLWGYLLERHVLATRIEGVGMLAWICNALDDLPGMGGDDFCHLGVIFGIRLDTQ